MSEGAMDAGMRSRWRNTYSLPRTKYAEVCPTCDRKTVEAWRRASGRTAAPSEIIDQRGLESEGEGDDGVATSLISKG